MHPASRKGPTFFYKKNTPPHFFTFLQPPIFYFFYKKNTPSPFHFLPTGLRWRGISRAAFATRRWWERAFTCVQLSCWWCRPATSRPPCWRPLDSVWPTDSGRLSFSTRPPLWMPRRNSPCLCRSSLVGRTPAATIQSRRPRTLYWLSRLTPCHWRTPLRRPTRLCDLFQSDTDHLVHRVGTCVWPRKVNGLSRTRCCVLRFTVWRHYPNPNSKSFIWYGSSRPICRCWIDIITTNYKINIKRRKITIKTIRVNGYLVVRCGL